jgi:hypothetical protein
MRGKENHRFAGLLVSGGRLLCRDSRCFVSRDDAMARRIKILRFVNEEEVYGRQCAACGKTLAAKPSFLR